MRRPLEKETVGQQISNSNTIKGTDVSTIKIKLLQLN